MEGRVATQAPVGVRSFVNHLPVRIRFGDGAAWDLAGILEAERARRVLIVVEEGFAENSAAGAATVSALDGRKAKVSRFDKPAGEPTIAMVDAAAACIASVEADAVVAIGGGSVIDTAKAARLAYTTGMQFSDWLISERPFPSPAIKLIAVPTTAGTGSEVSGGAVVTDENSGRKSGIADPSLRADHAVVDPVLTRSVPPRTTAYTGIDALAQAIAGMVATTRTPVGDALALEAVRLVHRSLTVAYNDGSDAAARSEMACASLLAGLTMNVSDCAAEHSLGQAIASRFPAPHGLTVGLVLAETLERERRYLPGPLERVADAFELPDGINGDGSRAVAAVTDLLRQLDFPVLGSLGVAEGDLDALVQLASEDYFIGLAPAPWGKEEIRAAFSSALALQSRVDQ